MITEKYENVYRQFVEGYEKIHLNPWNCIDKGELEKLHDGLVESMNVDNDFNFCYFINFLIKRLSGKDDAHTSFLAVLPISLHFRVFSNEAFLSFPEDLKNAKLLSVNGVKTEKILAELDEIITYGTDGRRRFELEIGLCDKFFMFALPSFRDSKALVYKIEKPNGEIIEKKFDRTQTVERQDMVDYYNMLYGEVGAYKILGNSLIYSHRCLQPRFEEKIKQSIKRLNEEDLSKINSIIVDLRGNTGGNAALNKPLMDLLKKHSDKVLCCLTDYRIFSGGRYALRDLIDLGATTIGEEISTPINCFGDSHLLKIDGYNFTVSEAYFHPFKQIEVFDKQSFKKLPKSVLKTQIFHPDIEVKPTKENFLQNQDVVLEQALRFCDLKPQKSKRNFEKV